MTEAELAWLSVRDVDARASSLRRSRQHLLDIARLLDGKLAMNGAGLVVEVTPTSKRGLSGWAENDALSFTLTLRPPSADDGRRHWEVEAEIWKPSGETPDYGQLLFDSNGGIEGDNAEQALASLERLADWLSQRCRGLMLSR